MDNTVTVFSSLDRHPEAQRGISTRLPAGWRSEI